MLFINKNISILYTNYYSISCCNSYELELYISYCGDLYCSKCCSLKDIEYDIEDILE
jgi:late competence protein required for DNA uptake (superfamily II DNA/RNA helicase)